jgi:hypothetical protein
MSFILFKTIFTIIILLLVLGFSGWFAFNRGGKHEDAWYKISLGSFMVATALLVGYMLCDMWLS